MVALDKMVFSVLYQALRIGEGQDLPSPRLGFYDSCVLQRGLRWPIWAWLVSSEQQLYGPILLLLVDWPSSFTDKPADSPFLLLNWAADCVWYIRVRFRRAIDYMVAKFNRYFGSCAAGRESARSLVSFTHFF
jgi:hypothetical protein